MNTKDEVKDLISDWYNNKAKNEKDSYFRFICLWICFNAWLDHQSNKNNDRDMIEWLKMQTPESSDIMAAYVAMRKTDIGHQRIKDLVSYSPFKDSKGRRDDIEIANENDINNIINAVYRIRCNLFHGGKSSINNRDNKLIKTAAGVMERWVSELISGF